MTHKVSVVVEKDESGFYVWCPELKGCQSQGATLEEAMTNIREAVELYLETIPQELQPSILLTETDISYSNSSTSESPAQAKTRSSLISLATMIPLTV